MAEQSRAQQLVGRIAPKLAELTDEVLFGDVWARPGLARRDRSLITVAALAALGRTEQLPSRSGPGQRAESRGTGRGGDAPGVLRRLASRDDHGHHSSRGPQFAVATERVMARLSSATSKRGWQPPTVVAGLRPGFSAWW